MDQDIFKTWAHRYFELGYNPIPADGKVPLIPNWSQWCTVGMDTVYLDGLVKRFPDKNLGIACGRSVVAIDIDEKDDEKARQILSRLPASPMVRRGAKGYAVLYRGGAELRGRRSTVHPIDFQGVGKFLILPPSIHPDTGNEYHWVGDGGLIDPAGLPPAPTMEEVEAICDEVGSYSKGGFTTGGGEQGPGRNSTLWGIACSMVEDSLAGTEDFRVAVERLVRLDGETHANHPNGPYFKDRAEKFSLKIRNGSSVGRAAFTLARALETVVKQKQKRGEPINEELERKTRTGLECIYEQPSESLALGALRNGERAGKRYGASAGLRESAGGHGEGASVEPGTDDRSSGSVGESDHGDEDSESRVDASYRITDDDIQRGGPLFARFSEYVRASSGTAIAPLEFGGAVALASLLGSNRIRLMKTWAPTYNFCVAPSGLGKSYAQRAIQELGAKEPELMRRLAKRAGSAAAIPELISGTQRDRMSIHDEFHGVLLPMGRPDNKNPFSQASEKLCDLYSASGSMFVGTHTRTGTQSSILNPALSLLGSGTIYGFQAAMTPKLFSDGFMARCFFWVFDPGEKEADEIIEAEALYGAQQREIAEPEELLARIREWLLFQPPPAANQPQYQEGGIPSNAFRIDYDPDAIQRLTLHNRALKRQALSDAPLWAPTLMRGQEQINKLCLCWIVSHRSPDEVMMHPFVPLEALEWAISLFDKSLQGMISVSKNAPGLKFEGGGKNKASPAQLLAKALVKKYPKGPSVRILKDRLISEFIRPICKAYRLKQIDVLNYAVEVGVISFSRELPEIANANLSMCKSII